MTHINIIAEGPTEEQFIKHVLGPYLGERGVFVYPRLLNGHVTFERLSKDIKNTLKEGGGRYCTTFFDYYGMMEGFSLPTNPSSATHQLKKMKLEAHLNVSICQEMGTSFDSKLFFPYVQMYEFEALLFSDPLGLARGLQDADSLLHFQKICAGVNSPEEINDSRITAPSKRIIELVPFYKKQKPRLGLKCAQEVTLNNMLAKCPLFAAWVKHMEGLK